LGDLNNGKISPSYNGFKDLSQLALKLAIQSNDCAIDLNARVIPAVYQMSLVIDERFQFIKTLLG